METKPNEIPPSDITQKEEETFQAIYALLAKGGKFLGNFWVNRLQKGGVFEIKIELGNRMFVFETTRCFPEIFSLPPAKST